MVSKTERTEYSAQDALAAVVDSARADGRGRRAAARQCHAFLKQFAKGAIKPKLVLAPAETDEEEEDDDEEEGVVADA